MYYTGVDLSRADIGILCFTTTATDEEIKYLTNSCYPFGFSASGDSSLLVGIVKGERLDGSPGGTPGAVSFVTT